MSFHHASSSIHSEITAKTVLRQRRLLQMKRKRSVKKPQNPCHLNSLVMHELEKVSNCTHCGAARFQFEPPTFCCDNGKIVLASSEAPDELYELFTSGSEEAIDFRRNIRSYNCIFSFTSFGVKLDKELASARRGVYSFRAQGMVYHDLPGLIPRDGATPGFFQLYFYDTENEVENRMNKMKNQKISETIVKKLLRILEVNPYAKVFRRLKEYPSMDNVQLHISKDVNLDQRVYNSPHADQVAAIWVEGNDNIPLERDIVVHAISGEKYKIKHFYGCYDPLQYPLLFPKGETGWHQNIKKTLTTNTTINATNFDDTSTLTADNIISREQQDVQGDLVKVQPAREITIKSSGASKTLRDITIMTKESKLIQICLWEDMANNEGVELEKKLVYKPSIAISNVLGKEYLKNLQLSSTMRSVLKITQANQESESSQNIAQTDAFLKIDELTMAQKMRSAKEVTLKHLIENLSTLSKDQSYFFTGITDKVENKSAIWYDSCKRCYSSCTNNADIKICKKCKTEVLETEPRFVVVLNIVQGENNAKVTMFNEVAAAYVGCNVKEYISSISEGEQQSTYYRGLSLQTFTKMRFMFAINKEVLDENGNLKLVANAIEKTTSMSQSLCHSKEESPQTQEDQDKKVKQAKVGRKKKPNKEFTSDDVMGKKKKTVAKKRAQDYIQITSDDDDQPLAKMIPSTKKMKQKNNQPIKIKQEKN